jgi:hypothetical protein
MYARISAVSISLRTVSLTQSLDIYINRHELNAIYEG